MFIDGIGNYLFEQKKATYPPLPFKLGSYKFAKVKQAAEFIEELGKFHFGEMPFRRNDTHGRMAEHCKEHKVHFEYTHHFDKEESVFRSAPNLTALRRRFKPKNPTKGGKGAEQARAEQARAEEEAKRRQEEAQKLEQEATEWLQKGEEEKIKAAQEAAEKAQEAAKETEEVPRQAAEEAKRKLDEELQKQEAEKIELPQQSIAET